jgi:predicted nucleic acid-binding protein
MNSMSGAEHLEFVDTNILVYAHDSSAGHKHDKARWLLGDIWARRTGCLSVQVLQEFYVTVTQKVAKPLKAESAAQIIADLATWEVYAPNANDVLDAIQIQKRFQLSFWDAMIVAGALQLGCQILWTEDLSAGQVLENVTITNPFL